MGAHLRARLRPRYAPGTPRCELAATPKCFFLLLLRRRRRGELGARHRSAVAAWLAAHLRQPQPKEGRPPAQQRRQPAEPRPASALRGRLTSTGGNYAKIRDLSEQTC